MYGSHSGNAVSIFFMADRTVHVIRLCDAGKCSKFCLYVSHRDGGKACIFQHHVYGIISIHLCVRVFAYMHGCVCVPLCKQASEQVNTPKIFYGGLLCHCFSTPNANRHSDDFVSPWMTLVHHSRIYVPLRTIHKPVT